MSRDLSAIIDTTQVARLALEFAEELDWDAFQADKKSRWEI
jgi:hypothetical protein